MSDSKQPGEGSKGGKPLPEGYRPLSDAPVTELIDSTGKLVRIDAAGRVLCHATRRDGEKCKSPTVTGMKVCRMHGGSTERARNGAKLRLAELVNPAIGTLAREMANADRSVDRQRAANSILDRAGYGRQTKVEVGEAKEQLYQKLLAMQESALAADEPDPGDMDFNTIPPTDPEDTP